MNLKKLISTSFIIFSILVIAPKSIYAQEVNSESLNDSIQYNLVYNAINRSEQQSSISAVDSLFGSNKITIDKYKAQLYYYKATFLQYKYDLENYDETIVSISLDAKAKEVLKYFNFAISKSDCINLAKYQHGKFLFLYSLVQTYKNNLSPDLIQEYLQIKNELKPKGLKIERFGFGLGFDYHIGKKQWLGIGFSLINGYTPKLKYKTNCEGINYNYIPEETAIGMTMLTFGYAHAINYQSMDYSFSLVEMYAPIRIVPAKFGLIKNSFSEESHWYYRPTVGVSYGPISISYAYNLMFKKSARANSETHLLNLEFNYPITNWNEPKW